MSIYENWLKKAYDEKGQSLKEFWDEYIPQEQKIYEDLIGNKINEINLTLKDLAKKYNVTVENAIGFIDGIHEVTNPLVDVKDLEEDSLVSFKFDFKELYMKMVEYKAEHLYELPQWNSVFTPEERRDFYFEQKKSKTVVKSQTPSRNDPCPCGSGKKYKKCCGQ